jgi:hypothetical protein
MAFSSPADAELDATNALGRVMLQLERHERLVFAALLAIVILPIWLFKYFPAWDSPLHLHMADVMAKYGQPGYEILSQYLVPNQMTEPNLAAYYLLMLFASFTNLYVAEKLLMTLYAVLLCCSARYAVRAVNPQAPVLSLLFIPTAFTLFIHMGLYNFSLSIALFIFVYAFWFKRRSALTPWSLGVLAALSLVLVLVHLLGFAMLVVAIATTSLYDGAYAMAHAPGAAGRRAVVATLVRRALAIGLALLPGFAIVLSFFLRHGVEEASAIDQDRLDLLQRLVVMDHLYSFARIEVALYAPFVLLVAFLVAYVLLRRWKADRWRPSAKDGLAATALVLALLYFFVPMTTKGVSVAGRLLPFLFAALFLWFATVTPGPLARRAVLVLVGFVCLTSAGYRIWQYDRLNGFIAEYVSAAQYIEPHSTLLPIHFWHESDAGSERRLTWRTNPLYHAPGHIGVERDVVNLRNLFLSPEVLGYFPMRYREELDPYVHIGPAIDQKPPVADFLDYEERTGGSVDYVLVMATQPLAELEGKEAARIARQLERGYDLIYTSPGHGFARLYRRRADVADGAATRAESQRSLGGADREHVPRSRPREGAVSGRS